MKLILVRHAIAEDRQEFKKKNKNDDLRPLTKKGIKNFQKNLKVLYKDHSSVDCLLSSPLVRAHQTAQMISKKFKIKLSLEKELKPTGAFDKLLKKILRKKAECVCLVGHEPFLSQLVFFLIFKQRRKINFIKFKKGAFCILERKNSRWQITSLVS